MMALGPTRPGPGDEDDDDDELPIGDPPDDDEGDDWDEDDDDDEEPLQASGAITFIALQHRHRPRVEAQWRPHERGTAGPTSFLLPDL